MRQTNLPSLIWSFVDLLRGDYQQSDFGEEILSRAVLRRVDGVVKVDTEPKGVTNRIVKMIRELSQ
jgi:hypothetical protein